MNKKKDTQIENKENDKRNKTPRDREGEVREKENNKITKIQKYEKKK